MTTISMRIEGLRELQAALKALGPEVSEAILTRGLREAGEALEQEIATRTPVAPEPHRRGKSPGVMRESVTTTVAFQSPVEARVTVGPRVAYAHLVEFGHAIIARGPGKGVKAGARRTALKARRAAGAIGHVPAKPFVRPAFDAVKERLVGIFTETVRGAVDAARALRRVRTPG